MRYEVQLNRQLERLMNQLERLQRLRRRRPVPPQIDAKVSSSRERGALIGFPGQSDFDTKAPTATLSWRTRRGRELAEEQWPSARALGSRGREAFLSFIADSYLMC